MGTPTTIPIDSDVRDMLKRFTGGGMTYSEAIKRLIYTVQADRFFDEFEAAIQDPDYPWERIDLDDEEIWS